MVMNDVDGLDNIRMLEGGADTELCGDLLLVLLFRLSRTFLPEFLHCIYVSAVLALDKAYGASRTAAKDLAPLSVLLAEGGIGSLVEGVDDGRVLGRCGGRPVLTLLHAESLGHWER